MAEIETFKTTRATSSKLSQVDFDNISFGSVYSDHMFVADYIDGQWQDMQIVPFGHFQISPACAALHYAQSIFEGLKAYKGDDGDVLIFRPDENAKRMNRSAERLCMPSFPEEIFVEAIKALLHLDKDWVPYKAGTSLYIRPFMFANDEFIGVRPSKNYRFMIFTGPVGGYYAEPVRVKVETEFSRAFPGGTGFAKCAGNYAASLYPAMLAGKDGYHQLLWTDGLTHQYFEESGTMNVMFLVGDTIVTPKTSDTILHGITRKSVLEMIRDWGLKVEERNVSVQEIRDAAENGTLHDAFGVGTAATIAHIRSISFGDKEYELPPVAERTTSTRILQELDAIKTGKAEDKYGWTVRV